MSQHDTKTIKDDHEWVAWIIRLQRFKTGGSSEQKLQAAKIAPVLAADLLTADIILSGLDMEPAERERLYADGR